MTIYAFVSGITALLSSASFLSSLVIALTVGLYAVRQKHAGIYAISFCFLIPAIFALMAISIYSTADFLSKQNSTWQILHWAFSISFLVISVWLVLQYSAYNRSAMLTLSINLLSILALSLLYCAVNFSSAGPLLASSFLSDARPYSLVQILLPMLAFGVGTTLPMAILIGIFTALVKRLRHNAWFGYIFLTLACFYLFAAANKIFWS